MVIIDHAAIPAVETLASVLHQFPSTGTGIELQLLAVQCGQIDLRVVVARIVLLLGFPALLADEVWRPPGPGPDQRSAHLIERADLSGLVSEESAFVHPPRGVCLMDFPFPIQGCIEVTGEHFARPSERLDMASRLPQSWF